MQVVPTPQGKEIIKILELFVVKYDNLENKHKAKVRFVARGDLVKDEKRYYSPVASHVAMRLFTIICVGLKMIPIQQLDISNAFIYGRLKENIYIQLPKGHPEKDGQRKVWMTQSSIYGLCQSPMIWNKNIDKFLRRYGCRSLVTEPCIYILGDFKNLKLILILYVDDILFSGQEKELIRFKNSMQQQFKLKSKDIAEDYVGIQMTQDKKGGSVYLHQKKHIEEALRKFNLAGVTTKYSTPTEVNQLSHQQEIALTSLQKESEIKNYQAIVGSLNYLSTCSRPDIAYAVCVLSQRAANPTKRSMKLAERCLIYLNKTKHYSIRYQYKKEPSKELKVFVDSSFANAEKRRSIQGFAIFLDDKLLHWKSKVSPMVCTSTTEAEFVAAALTMKDVLWIESMLEEIGYDLKLTCVYCDNQGAVKIFQSESSTARTKHLDIRLQFIKETFKKDHRSLRYVKSEDNLADVFTKALGRLNFQRLVHSLMETKE